MKSLQGRLSLGLFGSLVVLFALQWMAASLVLRNVTEQQAVARLELDAESLLAALAAGADGTFHLDATRLAAPYARAFSGHYYAILTPAGPITSRSLWDTELPIEPLAPGTKAALRLTGPEGQRLLVRAAGYNKFGKAITIAMAEDLSGFDQSLLRFQIGYAVISAIALIGLILTQRVILLRSLRPLERVRNEMLRLERGETESVSTSVPAEVTPLVHELNRLLQVLRQRGRRSREALGNLAHALKTQLALLTQVAEEPGLQEQPELRSRLLEPVERIRSLTERELKRARLAGAPLPGQKVDIAQELERLVAALRMIYSVVHSDKPLAIDLRVAPGAQFKGDAEDFLELMGNLLDNAAKFCRERVRISVTIEPQLLLRVEDDGPGCAEDKLGELTTRGIRADETIPGTGLGLAIARDIADSYGAGLRLGRSPDLGGFLAEVTFPRIG